MKLLFCNKCGDIFSLCLNKEKKCNCGETKGKYLDNLNAEYSGKYAIPLGFTNDTFLDALQKQPQQGMGKNFTAFVIPSVCETFKKLQS